MSCGASCISEKRTVGDSVVGEKDSQAIESSVRIPKSLSKSLGSTGRVSKRGEQKENDKSYKIGRIENGRPRLEGSWQRNGRDGQAHCGTGKLVGFSPHVSCGVTGLEMLGNGMPTPKESNETEVSVS